MNDGLTREGVIEISGDSRGNTWLATSGGATRYNSNFIPFNISPPPVYVTDFKIFGETNLNSLKTLTANLPHNVVF